MNLTSSETPEQTIARLEAENAGFRQQDAARAVAAEEEQAFESLIYAKTSVGLTRVQAINVLNRQKAYEIEVKKQFAARRPELLKVLKKLNVTSETDLDFDTRMKIKIPFPDIHKPEILAALEWQKAQGVTAT